MIAAALLLLGTAAPQDEEWTVRRARQCCDNGKPKPWDGYNQAVTWTQSIDDAFAKAKKEGKVVMVFHLVGDLDKEGC